MSNVDVTATAAAERREHALLCKEVVKVMPSWRRFSVDKHGTVHIREVTKPHWHGKAAPSPKGAISGSQPHRPRNRLVVYHRVGPNAARFAQQTGHSESELHKFAFARRGY